MPILAVAWPIMAALVLCPNENCQQILSLLKELLKIALIGVGKKEGLTSDVSFRNVDGKGKPY